MKRDIQRTGDGGGETEGERGRETEIVWVIGKERERG